MEEKEVLLNVFKVFGLAGFSFFMAFFSTPLLTHFLFKYKMWENTKERAALAGGKADIISGLNRSRTISGTPRMGGILIWATALLIAAFFWLLAHIFNESELFIKLNFLSRGQTWLPLFAFVAAALVGLADDRLQIKDRGGYVGGGLALTVRVALVVGIGLIGAIWFYGPLETASIFIPFFGELNLGVFFIPFFVIIMLAVFSGGVIDGLDGLAGGVYASIIASYGGIAFFQNQIDLAALLAVIGGALLAFLWYNIPPARFYMGETGILGLAAMLTIVTFLTNAVLVLPIIAFPLVIEAGSVIIQIASKKIRGTKVFLAAPIHHHFEAKGWPHYKVTMRFWIVSVVTALIGMVIHLIGK